MTDLTLLHAKVAHEKSKYASIIYDLQNAVSGKIEDAISDGLYKTTVAFHIDDTPETVTDEIKTWIESFGYYVNIYRPVITEEKEKTYNQSDYFGEINISW